MNRVALENTWCAGIKAYQRGFIVSERALQAVLYAALYQQLCKSCPDSFVLVEPRLKAEGFGPLIPDLVVIQDRQITAVVELKYVPHGCPVFKDDLSKLALYAKSEHSFKLLVDPLTGHYQKDTFKFSPQCLLTFACIGRHDAEAVHSETLIRASVGFQDRFVPLVYGVMGT